MITQATNTSRGTMTMAAVAPPPRPPPPPPDGVMLDGPESA